MSNDELRKKCFDLECALGKAIKTAEEARDFAKVTKSRFDQIYNLNDFIIHGVKDYLITMDKMKLLNTVNEAVIKTREIK